MFSPVWLMIFVGTLYEWVCKFIHVCACCPMNFELCENFFLASLYILWTSLIFFLLVIAVRSCKKPFSETKADISDSTGHWRVWGFFGACTLLWQPAQWGDFLWRFTGCEKNGRAECLPVTGFVITQCKSYLSQHTHTSCGGSQFHSTPQCYCQGVSRADQVFLCHLLCHISTVSVVD